MPDGSVKYLHVVAHASARAGTGDLEVVGAVMDISAHRRAEYLTAQVFESAPDILSIVGRDYRFLRLNPAYERTWQKPADAMVGMHVADLFGTEVFEQQIKPNMDRCFAGEDVTLQPSGSTIPSAGGTSG